jgi:20S proteasome alpha/beta subunit
MTLIAALPCAEGSVVLLADSQETHGDLKASVEKLVVKKVTDWLLFAYAGAGTGELVDALGEAIEAALAARMPLSTDAVEDVVRQAVVDFHGSPEFRNNPADAADKRIEGFACVMTPGPMGPQLFEIRSTRVVRGPGRFVAGMHYPFYMAILNRLHHPDMSVQQAVLVGLLLFATAHTSNYVGGDTNVAVAGNGGIRRIENEVVRDLHNRVEQFLGLTDRLFLGSVDTSVSRHQFEQQLSTFTTAVTDLRDRAMVVEATRDVDSNWKYRSPYPALPAGAPVTIWNDTGRVTVGDPPIPSAQKNRPPAKRRRKAARPSEG